MPWRGPEYQGEFPTLGYQVADLIEATVKVPDRDAQGQPFILTDEQLRFFLWLYRIDPETGRFAFERGGQLVRPQKWGKGPLSAAWVIAEAHPNAPVVPAGWDANGEPVGKPWPTPWIQVTAWSEDQTANVWRLLQPMIELSKDLRADIPDTGKTRINLPGGGLIEPVTASSTSRLGQRITAALQDQCESMNARNGGRTLIDTQRRNLAGTGGRFLETDNAWDPVEQSVAQETFETGLSVHKDYPTPPTGSVRNKRERRKVLKAVYGDSLKPAGWVDLERIDLEVEELLQRDPPQAERFYLNRSQAGESVAFDLAAWDEMARTGDNAITVPKGDLITIGVDGARFSDALAVVATEVVTAHQWPLAIIERPDNAPDDYEHDFDAVDGAMVEAFATWDVWRVYIDPQYIEKLVDRWQGRWGEKRIIEWFTNRPRQVGVAVRRYREAVAAKEFTHDGNADMRRHIANARRKALNTKDDEGRPLFTLAKERHDSPNKIDASMAGMLSRTARDDAIAAGAKKKQAGWIAGY